jgi:hypothetical protein
LVAGWFGRLLWSRRWRRPGNIDLADPAPVQAVAPLDACPDTYLLELAEYLPDDWVNPRPPRESQNEIHILGSAAALPTEFFPASQARSQAGAAVVRGVPDRRPSGR